MADVVGQPPVAIAELEVMTAQDECIHSEIVVGLDDFAKFVHTVVDDHVSMLFIVQRPGGIADDGVRETT
jgi:hypothetical protein